MTCIVDTNVLMEGYDLSDYEQIVIPMTVIEELDKHNHSDSPEKAYKSRVALRFIRDNTDKIEVRGGENVSNIVSQDLDMKTNDDKILVVVYQLQNTDYKDSVFLTFDLNIFLKAHYFNINARYLTNDTKKDIYKGYKEVMMDEVEYAEFYQELSSTSPENKFNLLENEYLIIYGPDGTVLDKYRYTSEGYKFLNTREFKSQYWGSIKPISDDPVQYCAFDSLHKTDITLLFGKAGTGKTMLSLAYLMSQLQSNKIDKLYIVHSFETLKGAKTLGFLPGDKEEKILNSGIGLILGTKFGGIEQTIKPLLQSNKLEIIPTAELRGLEFGERDAAFITEAQNIDPYTMKTFLQRFKSGCKIVIEGDMLEQTDIRSPINGMQRVIDVFAGSKYFSCVKLDRNHRNPICELAEKI